MNNTIHLPPCPSTLIAWLYELSSEGAWVTPQVTGAALLCHFYLFIIHILFIQTMLNRSKYLNQYVPA